MRWPGRPPAGKPARPIRRDPAAAAPAVPTVALEPPAAAAAPAKEVAPPAKEVAPPAKEVAPLAKEVAPPAKEVAPPAKGVAPALESPFEGLAQASVAPAMLATLVPAAEEVQL